MSTRVKLLKLLEDNMGRFVSGQHIGEELNVSRNAIWKAVDQLKKDGYDITSKPSAGYMLNEKSNLLSEGNISGCLKYPCQLTVYDSIDSTNTAAKSVTLTDKPALIIANKQTAGRGRLGRNFASPAGTGLYLSIVIKPDFDLDKSLFITMACAVAVCRALEKAAGIRAKIKWVNDIFYNNKKICGILTEAQTNFETGKIDSLIMGIGVNCFPGSFPEEIQSIAGAVSEKADSFSRNELAAEIYNEMMSILEDFQSKSFFREYKNKCFILGKEITVHQNYNGEGVKARAIDIDDNGGLVIEYLEGRKSRMMETVTTGEVSIKF